MGQVKIEVDSYENHEYVQQILDMFLGRTKVAAAVIRTANSNAIKAVLVESASLEEDELRRIWKQIESVNPYPLIHPRTTTSTQTEYASDRVRRRCGRRSGSPGNCRAG